MFLIRIRRGPGFAQVGGSWLGVRSSYPGIARSHHASSISLLFSASAIAHLLQTDHRPSVLDIRSLRKAYGETVAVDGLDLEVRAQECFGIIGPNGAGKTTTVEICEGLVDPDSGDVTVLGRHWEHDAPALRQRIGISLQETQFSEKLTVRELLALFRSFYDRPHDVSLVLGMVQLEEKASARIGSLSGGQKQRLAVACALIGDPELLFLDEPTTGLDPQSRRQMWEVIEQFRASGKSIVLTTHYMEEAERLCDRIAIVDHGKVIARGTPNELIAALGKPVTEVRTSSATLEDVFMSLTGRHLRDE